MTEKQERTRHHILCRQDLWELLHRENGSASKLLENSIEQRYGKYQKLYESFHTCSRCGAELNNWSDVFAVKSLWQDPPSTMLFSFCEACHKNFSDDTMAGLDILTSGEKSDSFNLFKKLIDFSAPFLKIDVKSIAIIKKELLKYYNMSEQDLKSEFKRLEVN